MSLQTTTHTAFRVRFKQTRGLAALFEHPANSYGWTGHGVLRIEPLGVHIAACRRRFGITRSESHFVAGHQIRDVYRQAESVRLDFDDESRGAYVKFWAEDSTAAASIVGLLPTSRTVESDSTAEVASQPLEALQRYRKAALIGLALASLIAAVWLVARLPTPHVPALPALNEALQPDAASPLGQRQPTPIAAAQLLVLKEDYQRFAATSEPLKADFMQFFLALQQGRTDQNAFLQRLANWLIPRWESEAAHLQEAHFEPGSDRARLRDLMVHVTQHWQQAFRTYGAGLQAGDVRIVNDAFASMAKAEQAEREAQELIRRGSGP